MVSVATACGPSATDPGHGTIASGASISVAGPVLLYSMLGKRAEQVLNEWKSRLTENNATVMAVLLLVLGLVLVGRGIGGLID
jgi:hypothetical protein